MQEIKKVRLIGLGAMGSFFAPKLSKLAGIDFKIIAGGARAERLRRQGLTVTGEHYDFDIVDPADTADGPADLIIVAVKNYSLREALEDIRNQVGENTHILCVQNGVESEDIAIEYYGEERVIPSYMRVSIVMQDGVSNYNGTAGLVHFGEWQNVEGQYSERVQRVEKLVKAAGLPYEIDPDMRHGQWFKFMCNVGENLSLAMLGVPFGAFRSSASLNYIRIGAMKEVIALANAKGIDLSWDDVLIQEPIIMGLPYFNTPSTLQDLQNKRRTEIETFGGAVLRMGEELGIPTPITAVMYHSIKTLEEKNDGEFDIEKGAQYYAGKPGVE